MSAGDDGTGDGGQGGLLRCLDRGDLLVRRFVLAEVLGPPRAAAGMRPPVVAAPAPHPASASPRRAPEDAPGGGAPAK